jgi:DNA repair protein RecO (recombination protein O)
MALYREQGIVLRTYKLGETDRIVHVLTQGRGKVRAVAKGVRKPGSRFGGRLEPFSHVDLQLYEGRSLDIVTQAELITPFDQVRAEWVLSACASTMAEGVDRVAQEEERSTRLFLLLLDGLRTLARLQPGTGANPAAVLDGFLFRLASVSGYHPYLDACASCGEPAEGGIFHLEAGGLLCRTCAPSDVQLLDPAVLVLLRALAADDWDTLALRVDDSRVRRAAGAIVSSFFTYHLGKPLKAWDAVPR